MKLHHIGATLLFVTVAAFVSWKTHVTLSPAHYQAELESLIQGRTPAAIRKNLDFSQLDGAELMTASQKRLATAARVILEGDDVGIELGHFVTRDFQGKKQLACDFYNQITLQFEADGIATSGEKPTMEIEGPCRTGEDITRIEPIWVPKDRILEEKPADMELKYDESTRFKFENISGEWPTRWVLRSVRLYNTGADTGREVTLSARELREIRETPVVLSWSQVPHRLPAEH